MSEVSFIATLFTSTVLAAAVSGFVAKKTNDKNMSLKYVTEERAKWREFIKASASKIYSGNYNKDENKETVITHLIISLNPLLTSGDSLDKEIRELLEKIEAGDNTPETRARFRYCVSTLLKYDWERSKNETRVWYRRLDEDTMKRKFLHQFYRD